MNAHIQLFSVSAINHYIYLYVQLVRLSQYYITSNMIQIF